MPDFSPNWDEIAFRFASKLIEMGGLKHATIRFPDEQISSLDLAWAIIGEPTQTSKPFAFGAVTVEYAGNLHIPVVAVDTGQSELSQEDTKLIRNLALRIQVSCHSNRRLIMGDGRIAYLSLGQEKLIRLSPVAGGDYGGSEIPYLVSFQYASN